MEKWHTLSRSYGVILPSSLMIVSSNAFVYSTSLLGQRQYLGTVSLICRFFQNLIYSIRLILHKSFSHRLVLQGRSINLEAVTLYKYHKLKARGIIYPFFVTYVSILTWVIICQRQKFYLRSMDFLKYLLHPDFKNTSFYPCFPLVPDVDKH